MLKIFDLMYVNIWMREVVLNFHLGRHTTNNTVLAGDIPRSCSQETFCEACMTLGDIKLAQAVGVRVDIGIHAV